MNKNDFLNMIGDSVHVNRQMIGEVYELINIFPYFQSAHLLLLKGLHNTADIKFENQLRNSAIHIADREVLYYLLKTPEPKEEAQPATADIIATANVSDQLTEAVINQEPVKLIPATEIAFDRANEIINPHDTSVISPDDSIEQPENKGNSDSVSDPGDLLELDQAENDSFDIETEVVEQTTIASMEDSGKKLQSDLIDRFIIANPRIEPNRDKTPLPPEDLTKHVQHDEGVFVTETLARIYVNQGYYSKAIDIYEKLSLKFPEKSTYFATQIEKVKEHLKN